MSGFAIFLVVVSVGFIIGSIYKSIQGKKQARMAELGRKYLAIQRQLDKANSFKTAAPRVRALEKALEILNEVQNIESFEEIFTDFHSNKAELESTIRVLPVYQSWDKAEKFRFKGNTKSEISHLLDALYEIKKEGLTVEDFQLGKIKTETGLILRKQMIDSRLQELGWFDSQKQIA